MSRWDLILWVVIPYAAITTFIVGHVLRYRRDQYQWGARSSQLLESKWLRIGSMVFHYGALGAIGGHAVGILVPHDVTAWLGVNESTYHVVAALGGVAAGGAAVAGFLILVYRRFRFPRVRAVTSRMDVVVFALLAFGLATGMIATLWGTLGEEVKYRETVGPWFRGLLTLDPRPELMNADHGLPFVFQLHVTGLWLLFASWPFSRLVHAWSIPVDWFRRAPILYRGRAGRPRAAASGRVAQITRRRDGT
jgi:nitrate reductase gamma subunit